MLQIYQRAKVECGYNATRFFQMIANYGGLKTAQKLLAMPTPSDGFVELWKFRRLDLSMENLVLNPKYRSLFSQSGALRVPLFLCIDIVSVVSPQCLS